MGTRRHRHFWRSGLTSSRLRLPFVICPPCVLLALVFGATDARAFCRTRSCEFDQDADCRFDQSTGCSTVGELAHWGDGCIPFAVHRDGSERADISAATLEELVDD